MTGRKRKRLYSTKNNCSLPLWARRCRRIDSNFVLRPDGQKQQNAQIRLPRRLAAKAPFMAFSLTAFISGISSVRSLKQSPNKRNVPGLIPSWHSVWPGLSATKAAFEVSNNRQTIATCLVCNLYSILHTAFKSGIHWVAGLKESFKQISCSATFLH